MCVRVRNASILLNCPLKYFYNLPNPLSFLCKHVSSPSYLYARSKAFKDICLWDLKELKSVLSLVLRIFPPLSVRRTKQVFFKNLFRPHPSQNDQSLHEMLPVSLKVKYICVLFCLFLLDALWQNASVVAVSYFIQDINLILLWPTLNEWCLLSLKWCFYFEETLLIVGHLHMVCCFMEDWVHD